jgi:ornithine cyclodeaminase/alanine dehydrogenase-like protein (mu-crystallin family)
MNPRILSAEDVRKALPMTEPIEALKSASQQQPLGKAKMPLRTPIEVSVHNGVTLFMPGYPVGDFLPKKVSKYLVDTCSSFFYIGIRASCFC